MPHQCTNCGRTFADGSKEMLSGCPDCGGNKFQFRPASQVTGSAPSDDTSTGSGQPESASSDSPDSNRSSPDPGTSGTDTTDPSASTATTPDSPATDRDVDSREPSRRTDPDDKSWPDPAADQDQAPESEPDTEDDDGGLADAAARAGAAVRDRFSGTDPSSESDLSSEVDRSSGADDDGAEDSAQATARSDVVSREELSAAARDVDSDPPQGPSESGTPSSSGPPSDESGSAGRGRPDADSSHPDENVVEPPSDDQPDLDELREELNDQFESIKIVNPGQYELNLMELYDRDEYIISLQEDGRYVIEVPDRWREDE
jgi:hypothetical protein